MHDTKSVFKELNGFPYKNACFQRKAIRVALLYSGFMSANIKAFRIQKFIRIPLGPRVRFFRDTRFEFPDYKNVFSYIDVMLLKLYAALH